jgi:hypothetical protein
MAFVLASGVVNKNKLVIDLKGTKTRAAMVKEAVWGHTAYIGRIVCSRSR